LSPSSQRTIEEERFKGAVLDFLVMALTPDDVYQALVLSSVFLMAISMPKVLIYTLWSSWRVYTYDHLNDLLRLKPMQKIVSKEMAEKLQEPEEKFNMTVRELDSYTRDMKEPLVELIAATIILPVSANSARVEAGAGSLVFWIEVLMAVVFILTFWTFAKRFLRLRNLKGGGPFI
jgi:hypothetical protein